MWNLFKKKRVLSESDAIVEERPFDISEPLFTMVKKIKDNPRRLKFEALAKQDFYHIFRGFKVVDIVTGTEVEIITTYVELGYGLEKAHPVECIDGIDIDLTTDEVKYLFTVIPTIYKEREKRLNELKALRRERQDKNNRKEMLKLWENT